MKGFYINLDSRKDRQEHIENNIKTIDFFQNIQRLSSIEYSDGSIGCGMSHVYALKQCLTDNDNTYFCILEDDFTILNMNNMNQFIDDFKQIQHLDSWDIIVLTPRGKTVESNIELLNNYFKRIIDNQTTTGYIIKNRFIPYLIQNLEDSIINMMHGKNKDIYSIDQHWKILQKDYNFYYYSNIFGGQLIGWSNTENRYIDYNFRFLEQNKY
jgi:GR25 family glycosyltransferase involved in LPS biosynthesis